ncbi:MAG: hypothetical protein MJH10_09305 [Epibacterium sp.]|nr:hypothetical protein [Epibacterium sp.]NQX73732.1 hypothetical protein [Epibacterium sp.]
MTTKGKQIPLPTGNLLQGDATGRGVALPPGADGTDLQSIGGVLTFVPRATVAAVDPTSDNDRVDTAGTGRRYFVEAAPVWYNNAGNPVRIFDLINDTPGAAVWKLRAEGSLSVFNYRGNIDASNSAAAGLLTGILTDPNTADGDVYRVTNTGGTKDFNGQFPGVANPAFVSATFEVGDNIVVFNGGFDKDDNTDPLGVTVFQANRFQEAGPVVAQTGAFALATTIPSTLQGGNADSVNVYINGEHLDFGQFSLSGAGPYTVTIDAALLGYPVDATDVIKVTYLAG